LRVALTRDCYDAVLNHARLHARCPRTHTTPHHTHLPPPPANLLPIKARFTHLPHCS